MPSPLNFPSPSNLAQIALRLAAQRGSSYGLNGAPVSPYSHLSGNSVPGSTPLEWLRGRYKCNQFVGDSLTYAGYRMPTWRMSDGSEHYVQAESLPRAGQYFARVRALEQIQSGDLLVLDWAAQGSNGAHVEIITSVNRAAGRIWSVGAHKDGAAEADATHWLVGAKFDPNTNSWVNYATLHGMFRAYILRPLRALG
ncbi:MAG: hypothetical protein K1X83_05320 [Oligoflexia bacterium]|nr:hypothetical protein [Oligoflexia bacterium]